MKDSRYLLICFVSDHGVYLKLWLPQRHPHRCVLFFFYLSVNIRIHQQNFWRRRASHPRRPSKRSRMRSMTQTSPYRLFPMAVKGTRTSQMIVTMKTTTRMKTITSLMLRGWLRGRSGNCTMTRWHSSFSHLYWTDILCPSYPRLQTTMH